MFAYSSGKLPSFTFAMSLCEIIQIAAGEIVESHVKRSRGRSARGQPNPRASMFVPLYPPRGTISAARPIIPQLNRSVINANLVSYVGREEGRRGRRDGGGASTRRRVLVSATDRKSIFTASPSAHGVLPLGPRRECFQEDGEQERWTRPRHCLDVLPLPEVRSSSACSYATCH